MSETLGRAQQLAQKEGREAQWAQVELQMAAWSERVTAHLRQAPGGEREQGREILPPEMTQPAWRRADPAHALQLSPAEVQATWQYAKDVVAQHQEREREVVHQRVMEYGR